MIREASDERKEKMRQEAEEAVWRGQCRKCGGQLVGKRSLFFSGCPKCGVKHVDPPPTTDS